MARQSPEHVQRSFRALNLHLIDIEDCIEDSWPIVGRSDAIPKGMTTFLPSQVSKHANDFVHFFIEDYRFERIWNNPERYVSLFKRYAGMVMPDFSTYRNMPIPMQMWNAYRNKAIAAYYQNMGIEVIPSLMWSDERSYEWVFDGMPIGGTYALGATGYDVDQENKHGFYMGLFEAIRCLKPDTLLVYGGKLKLHLPCKVIHYKNDNISRLRVVDERAKLETQKMQEEVPDIEEVRNDAMRNLLGKIVRESDRMNANRKDRVIDKSAQEIESMFGLEGYYSEKEV